MAKKPTGKGRKPDPENAAIDAALRFAAEGRWRDLTLAEIAEAAGLSLADLHRIYPSKTAILRAYQARVDREVLAEEAGFEADDPVRDRLFDVLMRRFDALKPHRAGLAVVLQDQLRDPLAALCLMPRLRRSMTAMLEAGGLSAAGCRGRLRRDGLTLIYLAALRVFFRDESDDLAKTMAALDRQLARADRTVGRLQGLACLRRGFSGKKAA